MMRSSRFRRPRGYAMTLFLVVLISITTVTFALASMSASSLSGAHNALGRSQARLLAASTAEDFYAAASGRGDLLVQYLSSNSSSTAANLHPAVAKFVHFKVSNAGVNGKTIGTGYEDCAGSTQYNFDCVKITLTKLEGTPSNLRSFLVLIEARVACGGVAQRCVTASFEQRLRRSQLYDYLFYNESGQIDPASMASVNSGFTLNCSPASSALRLGALPSNDDCRSSVPAYTAADVLDGAVYTDDDFVPVCGPAQFLKSVQVGGSGIVVGSKLQYWADMSTWRSDPCSDPSTTLRSTNSRIEAAVLRTQLPGTTDIQPLATRCASASTSAGSNPLKITASVLDLSRLSYSGHLLCLTAASTSVSGSVAGDVVLYTPNAVTIDNDITYVNGTSTTNATDGLAVVASGPITIARPTSRGVSRTIHGVLVSLNNSVSVESWWTQDACADPSTGLSNCVLNFTGTIAGKYRSVFGLYDQDSGTLLSGYAKNFHWDSRFSRTDTLLNYLPRPVTDGWLRLDLSEINTKN